MWWTWLADVSFWYDENVAKSMQLMFLCQRMKLSDALFFFFRFVAVRHLSWESVFIERLCFQFQPRSGILRRASVARTSSTTTTSRSRCHWSTRSWSFTPNTCESSWSFHPLQVVTLYKISSAQMLCPEMWVVNHFWESTLCGVTMGEWNSEEVLTLTALLPLLLYLFKGQRPRF